VDCNRRSDGGGTGSGGGSHLTLRALPSARYLADPVTRDTISRDTISCDVISRDVTFRDAIFRDVIFRDAISSCPAALPVTTCLFPTARW